MDYLQSSLPEDELCCYMSVLDRWMDSRVIYCITHMRRSVKHSLFTVISTKNAAIAHGPYAML